MCSHPRKWLPLRLLLLIPLALPFVQGCESSEPVSIPENDLPSFEILDAASTAGNPDFFFLPPMVSDPTGSAEFDEGAFDPGLSPVVEVWGLPTSDGASATLIVTFTMDGTGTTDPIIVHQSDELYQVNWNLNAFDLDPAVTYQVRVILGDNKLGHADVDLVSSGRELKNVDTGEYIPLKDGRTLPIKFRLEEGVGSYVGPAGGTVTAEYGSWSVHVQPGTFDLPVEITGTPITPPEGGLPGTAWEFGPPQAPFDPPVTLTIWYDKEDLNPLKYPRLHKLVGDEWIPAEGSVADLAAGTVSAPVDGFSHWTIIEGQLILTVDIREGNGYVWIDGLACGREITNPCELGYDVGETVILDADTDTSDPRFEEWIGPWADPAPCSTDVHCEFTITEDTEVIARFSMPGLLSVDPLEVPFSVLHNSTGSDLTEVLTVSNIGGRTATVEEFPISFSPDVEPWLQLEMLDRSIEPGESEPATLTVQTDVAASLFPGEYSAQVPILTGGGPWNTGRVVPVTLAVTTEGAQLSWDGNGVHFGFLPIVIFTLTDETGSDIYPVGEADSNPLTDDGCSASGYFPCHNYGIFDSGSTIVFLHSSAAWLLGMGAASPSNARQDTRVRISGAAAVDPTPTSWPPGPTASIGVPGTPDGAQFELAGVRVGLPIPPNRDLPVTLIGAPVANEVTAYIDQTAEAVVRGRYTCDEPDCNQASPEIAFFHPADAAVPDPALRVQMERFGSNGTSGMDLADEGFRYLIRNVAFREGRRLVTDDRSTPDPFFFFQDTGAPITIVNTRVAESLGLDLSAGEFDCFGDEEYEGYSVDYVRMLGVGSSQGLFTVNNASICVDAENTEIRTVREGRKVDAVIGMNLFMHGPILFEGKYDRLGIFPPGS